jgi:N-acetylglucosamine-6-phosphate deacetylase
VSELVLAGGRVVTPGGVVAGDVVIHDGRITSIDPARGDRPGAVDLRDHWVLPGFVDIHVHGGGGAQCNSADPDEIRAVARFHAQHGTTALLATTVAAAPDELLAALGAIGRAADAPDGARVLGAHLEGPFLNPCRPGAMDPEAFTAPDVALFRRFAAAGPLRSMTLAPELPGAFDVVAALRRAGGVASLGHTDATYEQAAAAVVAGARAVTHAFNAMRPLHHREPGMAGAALALDDLTCEVICDGVHVHPAAVRLLHRAKGARRAVLVTDAIAAAGGADGEYRLGARPVTVRDGRATLPGTDTLAGSVLTMDRAVRNAVQRCGVPLEDAARMAATTPAELLGLGDRLGVLAPGRDADVAILDADLELAGVLARGRWAVTIG